MRVLLVRPPSNNFYQIMPNLGIGYLAAEAGRRGHDVIFLDCMKERVTLDRFAGRLEEYGPLDVFGVQVFTNDFTACRKLFESARRALPRAALVAGGPHVTGLPDYSMRKMPWADFAVTGEAETGFCLLLDHLSSGGPALEDIPSLVWRQRPDAIRANPPAPPRRMEPGSRPAWALMDPRTYPAAPHGSFTRRLPTAPMILTRGCPFPCAYCAASLMTGAELRYREPEDACDEAEFLSREYGVREIHFEDDNFTFSKEKAAAFCEELLRRNLGICWALPNGVRLDRLDAEFVRLMERAGCYSMAVGVESGSNRLLRLMGRGATAEEMEEQVRMIRRSTRLRLTAFMMLGFPSETVEEMQATLDLAMRLPVDRVHFSNFLPLPGTRVFSELAASGEVSLDAIDWDSYIDNRLCYSPAGVSFATLRRMMRKGFFRFYARPRVAKSLLSEIHSVSQLGVVARRAMDTFF